MPRLPPDYGLTWPMFHAQSRMFVEFLNARDGQGIERLLADLGSGTRFDEAFAGSFGSKLNDAWAEFVDSLETEEWERM